MNAQGRPDGLLSATVMAPSTSLRLPAELVVDVMVRLCPKDAARLSATSRRLREVYLGSAVLALEALKYQTGYRVVNTTDCAKVQHDRIKAFVEAAALSEWHADGVVSLPKPVTKLYECQGVLLYIVELGGPQRPMVHVRQLGCPLRNIPERQWEWPLPPQVEHERDVEHVVMDPGRSVIMFVTEGETDEGIE